MPEPILQPSRPPRDPRDPVVRTATATADLPDPPPGLFSTDPELSVGRLHLDLEALDRDWQRVEGREAIGRLMEEHGVQDVYRWVRYHALRRGVLLPDERG